VVAIEIAECDYSAITIVEAKGPGGDEGVSGEAFWWERPERGCRCCKESKADNKEEKRKASWRTKASTEENAHGLTGSSSNSDRAELGLVKVAIRAYEIHAQQFGVAVCHCQRLRTQVHQTCDGTTS
jgi:hypothetical protein